MTDTHPWHSYPAEKALAVLGTDGRSGLSSARVEKKRTQYGRNALPKEERFRILRSIYGQLKSPLSIVFIGAGVATLFLHEYLDAVVIAIALVINVVVGVLQEGKAARIFDVLAQSQEEFATVLRDGKRQMIPTDEVVVGDIIVLTTGGVVPADARVLTADELSNNEAALTGEWLPVKKEAKALGRALPASEQTNMVWMGTLVAEGTGTAVVTAVGQEARFGQIAEKTNRELDALTPLQKSIRRLAHFLIGVIFIAIVVIVVFGILRGESLAAMLLLAIAVAVAAMPGGLPAAVTVVLALGMEAILRKGGLVKSLLAAETLGSTTVVLTDKTGTLTQGRMILSNFYTAQGIENEQTEPEGDNRELLKMAVLASDAFIEEDPKETGTLIVQGRPLEKAIIEAGLEAGLSQKELFANGNERLQLVQFETRRRFAISLNESPQRGNRLYFSGSPEYLLARSQKFFYDGRERKLTDEMRERIAKTQKDISAEGMRFTAIAYMRTTEAAVPEKLKEAEGAQEFVFVGLLAFADAVRPDVAESIAVTQQAGARVIMATGDYPETARAIAYEVGIVTKQDAPILTGADISQYDDEQLLKALQKHSIVARVLPEQKLRMAHVLRNSGEVVAMTGDGVNDAPALAAADIGVAVGSGTDVAKAAADVILIENSFSVITTAIAEGRRIIANLRKIVAFLLSTGFSEIVVISGALAIGSPVPLLPTQILWANLVQEGFMSFPFAFEPREKDAMTTQPQRSGINRIMTSSVRWLILIVSGITGLLLFGLFLLLSWAHTPIEEIRTVMFVALSIGSMFFAFSFKNLHEPIWRIQLFSNRYLLAALVASFALLLAALTFAPLVTLLSLEPMTWGEVGLLVIFGIVNLTLVETVKFLVNRRRLQS